MFGLGLGCVSMGGGGVAQSGISYQRPLLTGQTTSYRTGDDAWHLANGTYIYTPPAYPTSFAQLDTAHATPFIKLLANNAFGNKDRFTDDAGGQTYTNNYYIDHLTGLGFINEKKGASQDWDTNIDEATALTEAGFSDYRVGNLTELLSIMDWTVDGYTYSPLSQTASPVTVIQTSSTRWDLTANYLRIVLTSGIQIASDPKTTALTSRGYIAFRNHYT